MFFDKKFTMIKATYESVKLVWSTVTLLSALQTAINIYLDTLYGVIEKFIVYIVKSANGAKNLLITVADIERTSIMQRIMTIFGTRPEAIKMAPVIKALENDPTFDPVTVVTGQHKEMLDSALAAFHIQPDYNLHLMKQNQTLTSITVGALTKLEPIISKIKPAVILVHGDTTTTLGATLAAFYQKIPVGHVEAGLRTYSIYDPYPEEMNRQVTDAISRFYFAPTKKAEQNLLKEHRPADHIFVTGNTAIDALQHTVKKDYHSPVLDQIDPQKKLLLVTMHRRENQGEPMRQALEAIKEILISRDDLEMIFPVHLSQRVQQVAHEVFDDVPQAHLTKPLDVIDFHNLAARSYLILTDSGGVQEEAPSLKKPVLVLRDTTERPEGVTAGTLKLVGTDPTTIKQSLIELLDDPQKYKQMADARNPYGDGHASERIIKALHQYLDGRGH